MVNRKPPRRGVVSFDQLADIDIGIYESWEMGNGGKADLKRDMI